MYLLALDESGDRPLGSWLPFASFYYSALLKMLGTLESLCVQNVEIYLAECVFLEGSHSLCLLIVFVLGSSVVLHATQLRHWQKEAFLNAL